MIVTTWAPCPTCGVLVRLQVNGRVRRHYATNLSGKTFADFDRWGRCRGGIPT